MESRSDVVQTILGRRSIRFGFDRDRAVPLDVIETVTLCGNAAPSSKNARPWRFHVITMPAMLDELASLMETGADIESYVPHDPRSGEPHPHWQSTVLESAAVLRAVPTAILIENRGVFSGGRATLRAASPSALAGSLASYAFECVGIGTALENMWLAALSMGLSGAFVGDLAIAEDDAKEMLSIEGDLIGILCLGYSDAQPLPSLPSPAETQVDDPVIFH